MDEALYMDAVITPHRSLSQRGAITLIAVLTAINCATAAAFVIIGAAFVPLFIGLDLVAVIVALAASGRASKKSERVQVTADEVRVLSQTPAGLSTLWTSPTAFTRVAFDEAALDDGALRLTLSGRELPLARALNRRERLDFARALDRAIMRA
ncbi:MAG TPA: DUF2244 domain-containing protein, partial [Caulobacteraceae bacterium]